MKKLGSKIIFIIVWHIQRNDQTERINGIILMYLRYYMMNDHEDWIKWLPIAKFTYNIIWNKFLDNTYFQGGHSFDTFKPIDLIKVK